MALGLVGKGGLPSLLSVLTNRQDSVLRYYALEGIAGSADASSAVPILLQCLRDKDPKLVVHVTTILYRMDLKASLVVPEVLKIVQDTPESLRTLGPFLATFGDGAQPAVPALVKFLNDPDLIHRVTASNALREIDPIALQKATVVEKTETKRE